MNYLRVMFEPQWANPIWYLLQFPIAHEEGQIRGKIEEIQASQMKLAFGNLQRMITTLTTFRSLGLASYVAGFVYFCLSAERFSVGSLLRCWLLRRNINRLALPSVSATLVHPTRRARCRACGLML